MATFGDINPATGKKYTITEIQRINCGLPAEGTAAATTTSAATSVHAGSPNIFDMTPEDYLAYMPEGTTLEESAAALQTSQQYIEAQGGVAPATAPAPATTVPTLTPTTPPELAPMPEVTPAPEVEAPVVPTIPEVTPAPEIPAIQVAPAPAYEISPEQQEMQNLLATTITDWVQAGGYGLSPEVQALMIQQQTDFLKAREQENIRVMRNNMERKGITNSGFLISAESAIHSNTSVAIAGAIADVQIKSALMKMASFEKAMGAAAQFLGYLSEQSQLAYAPQFATWSAQTSANMIQYQAQIETSIAEWQMVNQFAITDWQAQTQALFSQWEVNANNIVNQWQMENQFNLTEWQSQAEYNLALFNIESQLNLAQWQGQMDLYKLELNNAYQTQNTILQGQIQSQLNQQQNLFDLELAEMELEAANQASAAQGAGSIFGTIIEGLFSILVK